jgi:predicted RNase H-like nuclease (RuvC/YqgF family)
MDDKDDVIDGEEVKEETDDTDETAETTFKINEGGSDQATAMLSLEELIKNHIDSIDKLKEELKEAREMFEDSFNNNPTYKEHLEKVKEVSKGKNSVRQQIAKQPSVATLEQKVKDVRFDINEKSKTLSDLLQDYKEQTGATSIETKNGKVLEIVSTAKLVSRSSK